MLAAIRNLWHGDEGQGMVEYGLILALVAIVVAVVLTTMSGSLKDTFTAISDKLKAATNPPAGS